MFEITEKVQDQSFKNMLSWRLEGREGREYIQQLTSFYYEFTLVITVNIACIQYKNYRYILLVISIINNNTINTDIHNPVTARAQRDFRELLLLAAPRHWKAVLDTSFHTQVSPLDTDHSMDLLICGKQLSTLAGRKWVREHVTNCLLPNKCNACSCYPCIK